MARTRIIPRKRIGGGQLPQLPDTLRWALQKPMKKVDNALHLETPKLLWDVLKALRYTQPPLYSGIRHPLGDRGYTWNVKVTLYVPRKERGGYFVMKKHRAIAPWSTFEEGCQDAARQALQVVCADNRRRLEHTEYVYLPYRQSASLFIEADEVEPAADPVVKTLRDTLKMQTQRLDAAQDEIAYLNERLDQQRREYMELQQTLHFKGEDLDEPELPFDLRPKPKLYSPTRKRLH